MSIVDTDNQITNYEMLRLEAEFIRSIRKEADEAKELFHRHYFQSLVFSIAVIGVIFNQQKSYPSISLIGIAVCFLLISVARVGISEYTSANRIFAYELYINRRHRISHDHIKGPGQYYVLGWEEAMYAWRIVQSKVYSEIFRSSEPIFVLRPVFWLINIVTKNVRALIALPNGGISTADFFLNSLLGIVLSNKNYEKSGLFVGSENSPHMGSHLRMHFVILLFGSNVALLPLLFGAYLVMGQDYSILLSSMYISLFIIFTGMVVLRARRIFSTLSLMEKGILSINSGAAIWHAVVVAHFRAIEHLEKDKLGNVVSFYGYTDNLIIQRESLILMIRNNPSSGLYDWIKNVGDQKKSEAELDPAASHQVMFQA